MLKKIIFIAVCIWINFNVVSAQTNNPVPESIRPSGLSFELEEFTSIQPSNSNQPRARINMLREVPDGSERLYVIDLRGFLWEIDGEDHSLFLNIKDFTEDFMPVPGKGTGFGAFAFHPDFATNGKFYTAHSEYPGSATADFIPEDYSNIAVQWVVWEWTMDNPEDHTFSGSYRELLRAEFPTIIHGIQDIQFNPNAIQGDPEYGKLYVCIGEGGSSLDFHHENIQTTTSYLGTIFRIDPLGNNSFNGNYGIPEDNPFVGENGAVEEIFAYGFRNPHRISWDTEGAKAMIIGDIGEKNLEEVNIGISGGNYGWDDREGTFSYKRELGRDFVYELPENDEELNLIYPVAQYDHDEGLAIVGGYVYRGDKIPELYGHYIFGDIPSGRVFHVPVENLLGDTIAEIYELNFHDANGESVTFLSLANSDRADLRFGIDSENELYFLTKADGKIRQIKSGNSSTDVSDVNLEQAVQIYPNPGNGLYSIEFNMSVEQIPYLITAVDGKIIQQSVITTDKHSINLSDQSSGIYYFQYWINHKKLTKTLIKK